MPGWWTAVRQAEAFNFLLWSGGLSPYGAAALVSRWANVESTAAGPSAINPYSGAFGIAQWLGSRKVPIAGNTSFEAQLAYVVQELNSTEARAAEVLRNAVTAQEGARGASIYERAEGYNALTGIDNWTARTSAGIPDVLAVVGGDPSGSSAEAYNEVLSVDAIPAYGSYDEFLAATQGDANALSYFPVESDVLGTFGKFALGLVGLLLFKRLVLG